MNFLSQSLLVYLLSCIIIPTYAMDTAQSMEHTLSRHYSKPKITGEIFISGNNRRPNITSYASQKYHEILTKAGISSDIQNPLIRVTVYVRDSSINDTTEWSNYPLPFMKEFEINHYKKKYNVQRIPEKIYSHLSSKVLNQNFPSYIPIIYLLEAKTGTQLNFIIHGYPTQLLCINNPFTNSSFEIDYKISVNNFISNPENFIIHFYGPMLIKINTLGDKSNLCNESEQYDTIIENKLMEKIAIHDESTIYKHGKKGIEGIKKWLANIVLKNNNGYFLLLLNHVRYLEQQ